MNTGTELREIIEPLHRGKFWMQLLGIASIIYGVVMALTIVGLIIAWIPIWAGVVLMQAAGAASRAFENSDPIEMRHSMAKLKTYFTIFGVLMLIGIVVMIVTTLFGIGAGMMGMGGMM
jgi:1,4-dihydroxy-2-naphthoate octaprenyltransferase